MKYEVICFLALNFSFAFAAELLKEDPVHIVALRGYLAHRSESIIEKSDIESYIDNTRSQVNLPHFCILPGIKLEQLAFGTGIRVGVGSDKKIFYCWFANESEKVVQYKMQEGNQITSIVAALDDKTVGTITKTSQYNGRYGSFICLSLFDVNKGEVINIRKLYATKLAETNPVSFGRINVYLTDVYAHIGNVFNKDKMKQIVLRPALNIEELTDVQKKFLEESYMRYLKKCEESPYDQCVIGSYSSEYKIYKTLPDSVKNWISSIIMVLGN